MAAIRASPSCSLAWSALAAVLREEGDLPSALAAYREAHQQRSALTTTHAITLQNSPRFHLPIDRCKNVTIDGITISSPRDAPNTDGIDLGGTTNVVIRNNHIVNGDDNVAARNPRESGATIRRPVGHDAFRERAGWV